MSKAKLGENLSIDILKLLETRMLIQANSGGGKSYAVRKLLEETHGKVQQIVLDMEGEFGTLREKYDYVLAGKGGDLEANPRTAELLARKVLELEVSLIVDLYELKKPDRIRFVRNFVDALVNAPKELWHPVLVLIDEAHVFAPEKGESEAAGAVIDLATRGRKRGFACVLATQRLSKLNKDVAAECLNKLVGRTSLDIDRKRAADELGFISQKDSLALRALKPGDFYAFGPAIHDEVTLGHVGAVATTHPKAGQRLGFRQTKPTEHIKAVLKKLTDLPQEVEAELNEKAALQKKIRELEAELKKVPRAQSESVDIKAAERAYERGKRQARDQAVEVFYKLSKELREHTSKTIEAADGILRNSMDFLSSNPAATPNKVQAAPPKGSAPWTGPVRAVPQKESGEWGACEKKILGFLSVYPGQEYTKVQVGAMTGYRHSSGGFNNALSKLNQAGLITRRNGMVALVPDAQISHLIDRTQHSLEDWIAKLGACERKIYAVVLENQEVAYSKQDLGEITGYSPTSGGFNNALSRLNTLGLIARQGGQIQFNSELLGI